MVSGKERLRIERWTDKLLERINRQKGAIDRLLASHVELCAALFEIAESQLAAEEMRQRARAALGTVAANSAAVTPEEEGLPDTGNPTNDEELSTDGE